MAPNNDENNLGIRTWPTEGYVDDFFEVTRAISNRRITSKVAAYTSTIVLENNGTVDTELTESMSCSETGSGVSSLTLPSSLMLTSDKDYLRRALHQAKLNVDSLELTRTDRAYKSRHPKSNESSPPYSSSQKTEREAFTSSYEMGIINTENARINARHAPLKPRPASKKSEDIVSAILAARSSQSSHCRNRSSLRGPQTRPSLGATLKILNQEHIRCQKKLKCLKEEASRSDESFCRREYMYQCDDDGGNGAPAPQSGLHQALNKDALHVVASFDSDDESSATSGYLSSDDLSYSMSGSLSFEFDPSVENEGTQEEQFKRANAMPKLPQAEASALAPANPTTICTNADLFSIVDLSPPSVDNLFFESGMHDMHNECARDTPLEPLSYLEEKKRASPTTCNTRTKWRLFRRKKTTKYTPIMDDEMSLLSD